MARKRKLAAAVFSLGCFHASSLMALGLGEIDLDSFLNEPLNASVDLLNLDGLHQDQIQIRLANSEDFARLGVERAYFLTTIKFEVVSDGAGGPRILISTEKPVLEPYLDFIVEARWPTGRLLREYTVLVDPPVYTDTPQVVSASQRVYEEEGIPAPESADEAPAQKPGSVGLFPDGSQGGAGSSGVQRGAGSSRVKTTGTRVDVRDSDLAPGAMPQRDFNAGAAATPSPGARYMISRNDTLWQIAERAKPAGASVHQEMLDIQRLNPGAFINGNINRIKAGYIIYLPTADDISSSDQPAALAEVQEQNAAWREGRDADLHARRGPTLRISAGEPETEAPAAEPADADAVASDSGEMEGVDAIDGAMPGTAGAEAGEAGAPGETGSLAEAEKEVETLKRIVALKDDQIAALQNALAEAGVEPDAVMDSEGEIEALYGDAEGAEDAGEEAVAEASLAGATGTEELVEEETAPGADPLVAQVSASPGGETAEPEAAPAAPVAAEPEPEPVATAEPAPEPRPADGEGGGWMSNLLYVIGAAIVAALAFAFVRRRRDDEEEEFESGIAVEPASDDMPERQARTAVQAAEVATAVEEPVEEESEAEATQGSRGYGERKHDEYAADVEESDALAEADIYIAYGRHPQAIDLLKNALEAEPNNPVYRLKLLEIYNELGDHGGATAQLERIQASGDADAIRRAESLMQQAAPSPQAATATAAVAAESLAPSPLELEPITEASLESDFSGLEIESEMAGATVEDDLDLSGDFASSEESADEEELVIADDGSGLSTKLDLARAYLDMGDDDGARQILDEVVAEGSQELKSEAQVLLDRIGG